MKAAGSEISAMGRMCSENCLFNDAASPLSPPHQTRPFNPKHILFPFP